MSKRVSLVLLMCLICAMAVAPAGADEPDKTAPRPVAEWVKKSNLNAKLMIELMAKLQPEMASQFGAVGYDDQISDLSPGFVERELEASRQVHAELVRRLAGESDPRVKQDLEILIKAAADIIQGTELSERLKVPDFSLNQLIFMSFRGLLDDQVSPSRRPAALVRLRKYAGLEPGTKPIAELAIAHIREKLGRPGLSPPIKAKLQKDLVQAPFFVEGAAKLFEQFKLDGYKPAYEKLKEQLAGWDEFVKSEVMPKSRDDFRMPAELYAFALEEIGIDIPPQELSAMAHRAFSEIQGEMREVAGKVARERNLSEADYRAVIRALKKEQLIGAAILPHYKNRLKEIEAIIRDKQIVSLPTREARIRIATEAESAATPAPNMHPPRLIGNTGEMGEFVLPLNVPDKAGGMKRFDDFTFAAASWTLTAHEARPGHELQFASIVEQGVSDARITFAFNSTNVEGWGLYAEWLIEPFEPAEGKLICLQHRLVRAARAFLDIELQTGKITREQALAVLKDDAVVSEAMANQEVERYTFRAPGQANSYFYGYIRLRELRAEVEKAMGSRFKPQAFHDFVLAQGLLPHRLLRKAVLEEFVGPLTNVAEVALPELVRRMADRINRQPQSRAATLWTATYLLMGLRFTDEFAAQLLEGVQSMQESTTYQAILKEGRNEGLIEGRNEGLIEGRNEGLIEGRNEGLIEGRVSEAQRLLLILGGTRFGGADDPIQRSVEAIRDLERLERMTRRVLDAKVQDWTGLLGTA